MLYFLRYVYYKGFSLTKGHGQLCHSLGNLHDFLLVFHCNYTVSQKKLGHFYFYCNFGKCWSILKILLLLESEGSS